MYVLFRFVLFFLFFCFPCHRRFAPEIDLDRHAHSGNCEKGCYISGLCIESAAWSVQQNALIKSNNLVEPLPILRVIPIEKHKLQTQVGKAEEMQFYLSI